MPRMLPVLFNTEMVRAILDGRKTVTRRLIKPQIQYFYNCIMGEPRPIKGNIYSVRMPDNSFGEIKPKWNVGDILYVRETWTKENSEYFYRADFDSDWLSPCETLSGGYPYDCSYHPGCEGCSRGPCRIGWHPSIHMPKDAARIFLRVKDVRAERLQSIDDAQAKAEGICGFWLGDGESGYAVNADGNTFYDGPIGAFSHLWDSTIKPADLDTYGWKANPWVWVIEFERISRKEAEREGGTNA